MGKKILNYFPFDDVNSINITRELGVSCKNLSEIETEIFNEKNNLNSKNNLVEIPNLIDNFNENYSEDEFVSVLLKQINKKEKFKFNYFVLVQKIKLTAALRSIINAFKYLPRYLFYKTKWEDYKMAISHFPGHATGRRGLRHSGKPARLLYRETFLERRLEYRPAPRELQGAPLLD